MSAIRENLNVDSTFIISDTTDPTKELKFDVSGITTGNTRTLTVPNINATLVGTTITQTLTNKTINTANNTLDIAAADVSSGTFANARIAVGNVTQHEGSINHDNLLGFVANEHLDWTTDLGATNIHQNNITSASVTQHEGSITIGNLSGAPSGSVVGTTDTQTLTNKTLTLPQINDTSSNHQYIFGVSELALDRTITLPLLGGNDTFVFEGHSQTLTNKTINADSNTITNIDNADIKAGAAIDAAKIANGSVSNAEFQYLGSVTSDIQTQLNAKSGTSHTHDWDAATGTADVIPFNTGAGDPSHAEGKVFYDAGEHALAVYNDQSVVTHQLGQEGYIRVYNNSGASITDGKPVYVSGAEGVEDRPTIGLARADTQSTSQVIGVTTQTIANNSFGYITYWGLVNDLDTSAFGSGDTIYLDDTIAGTLRNTPPGSGNYEVQIGFVIKSDLTTGRILVALNQNLASLAGDANEVVVDVVKHTAGTISAGKVVYVVGYDTGKNAPQVELADSSLGSTMPAFGIMRDSCTNTATGKVVVLGELVNQVTNTYSIGDNLYVSETAGELSSTKPTGSALVQKVGVVTRSHSSQGAIQVFGAGRSNDLPNLSSSKFWLGNGSGVPTESTVNDLTADATPDGAADYVMTWDNSATAHKKVLINDLIGVGEGESNSGANVGTAGVGVYKDKSGTTLRFKKINAGSSKVTITDDTGNDEIDVDLVEGNIVIGNLSGAPTGTVVGSTDTQTLTNKTLTSPIFTTPQINDTSSDHQYIFGVSELTLDRTVTLPLLTDSDTFVFANHAETLTNKTINTASNTITIDATDIGSGTIPVARGGTGQVTHTSNAVLKGAGTSGIASSGWTIDANNVMSVEANVTGFILDVHNTNPSGGDGFHIHAGEVAGDIAFKITDRDETFNILEMEANNGYIVTHKSYAETLSANGIVYGFDNQHSGVCKDFNTQFGAYRCAGNIALSATTLGTLVVNSSLTSVGTIGTGVWQGTAVGVAYGGTGTTTLGSGKILQGNGTGAITSTLTAPSGAIVGTTDTQTLTNKTWGDNLNMNSNKITNLATPTVDSDAASKSYVDGVATGLDFKDSVVAASTVDLDSNGSISGTITYTATAGASSRGQITATLVTTDTFTVDGVTFAAADNGSRILLKDQSTGSQNGIWTTTVSGTSLTLDRATDFDADAEVTSGAFTFVEEGTTNDNSGFVLSTNDPITIGGGSGTSIAFAQFSGSGTITAGSGMTKTGDTMNVIGSGTIIANADDLEVNSSVTANQILLSSGSVGTASTFGALPLGDSNAVSGTLPVSRGGSGATTLASGKILRGNGTGAITATLTAPSGAIVGISDTQTLTNKTINTASNTITIDADDVTSGTFANGRISSSSVTQHEGFITIGNLSGAPTGSVVGTTDTQTLSNKTMTSPIITTPQINDTSANHQYIFGVNELVADRTVTLPLLTGNDTFVFEDHTQTLTNKTINTASNTITVAAGDVGSGTFANGRIAASNVTQHEGSITIGNLSGAPSGTVVGTTDTQTLTNKTLTSAVLTTPQINDTSANHQYIFGVSELVLDRTVTLPLLTGNDTFVFESHTATLNNKTLTSTSNNVTAKGLHSATTTVSVSGATAPTNGQVLTATSGTSATWQTPTDSDVTAAATLTMYGLVVGDDGAKGIRTGTEWTLDGNGVLGSGFDYAGYILDVHNTRTVGGGNGFRIMAGEALGDIAFHVADADDTFQIMEMEADQGHVTLGKTYAQTLTDNGIVYGMDIQHTGVSKDFNTQAGTYRKAGVDCIMASGGTTGQVLSKINGTDYNTQWTTITKTIRQGHTWAIGGEVKAASGDTDFLVPMYISLASGQTAKLVSCRYKINSGTSVTAKVQKNDVDVTGFTGLSVTTTATTTDPADVSLADGDELSIIVSSPVGTPMNMTFTIFVEHTV